MQVLPSLESLLEIRHASTKSAACSSSVALPLSEERDSTEDRQDSSAQRVEENNNNRYRNKNRNRQSTKDAKDPGPDLDLDSVTATTATDVRVETSSVREEPRPHVRAEHSAPSRTPEPITGQTYELLILAAMSVRPVPSRPSLLL